MTKARKADHQGYTFKKGNSYRTVIKYKGVVITASRKSKEESRRLAKERLCALEKQLASAIPSVNKTLGDYLIHWLDTQHKHYLAQQSASVDVILVGDCRSDAGTRLHDYFVARCNKLMNASRGHRNTKFVIFDFFRNADNHEFSLVGASNVASSKRPSPKALAYIANLSVVNLPC